MDLLSNIIESVIATLPIGYRVETNMVENHIGYTKQFIVYRTNEVGSTLQIVNAYKALKVLKEYIVEYDYTMDLSVLEEDIKDKPVIDSYVKILNRAKLHNS